MSYLNELAARIYLNNEAKGWMDEERSFGDLIALCHSELSEALEEWRHEKPAKYYQPIAHGTNKPEGYGIELTDVLIRVLDMMARYCLDIDDLMETKMAFNQTRPYRHGGLRL